MVRDVREYPRRLAALRWHQRNASTRAAVRSRLAGQLRHRRYRRQCQPRPRLYLGRPQPRLKDRLGVVMGRTNTFNQHHRPGLRNNRLTAQHPLLVYACLHNEDVMKVPSGTIAMFYGLEAAIPPGWKSCDGTLGTPDLRDHFVIGAGIHLAPHQSGINKKHRHGFTSDGHAHTQPPAETISEGFYWNETSDSNVLTGITDRTTILPPYHALIFVQKI